jgi:hypothetical protein
VTYEESNRICDYLERIYRQTSEVSLRSTNFTFYLTKKDLTCQAQSGTHRHFRFRSLPDGQCLPASRGNEDSLATGVCASARGLCWLVWTADSAVQLPNGPANYTEGGIPGGSNAEVKEVPPRFLGIPRHRKPNELRYFRLPTRYAGGRGRQYRFARQPASLKGC